MRAFLNTLVVLACLVLAACAAKKAGVESLDDCIATYAVPAGTSQAVGVATGLCRELFRGPTSAQRLAWAECMLPKLATVRDDAGGRLAAATCRREVKPTWADASIPPAGRDAAQFKNGYVKNCTNEMTSGADAVPGELATSICVCSADSLVAHLNEADLRSLSADSRNSAEFQRPFVEACVQSELPKYRASQP